MTTPSGWWVFFGALGMFAGLVGAEIALLPDLAAMHAPAFIGKSLMHLATVIAAFIGGKLLPVDPLPGGRRGTDPQP